jgi:prophage maintenance system killer protein
MDLRSIEADALLLAIADALDAPAHDRRKLEAALLHPLTVAAAGSVDIADIAVAYMRGILEHAPFSRSNARAGLLAMELFLLRNGWRISVPDQIRQEMMHRLEAGQCSDREFSDWLRLSL